MSGELAHPDPRDVQAALAVPFDPSEVKFKPSVVKGNRALAMAYIDARCVQERLDEVLGVAGWRTEYVVVSPSSVECRLSCLIAGDWVTKADVGSTSDQPDAGDKMKAAYSDALKRAAVHFGVGRYLYRLVSQWCDYDPVKKMFSSLPQLPASARPGPVTHVRQIQEPKPAPRQALPAAVDKTPGEPEGQLIYDAIQRAILGCGTWDDLRAAWKLACDNREKMSPKLYSSLSKLKDSKKKDLPLKPVPASQADVEAAMALIADLNELEGLDAVREFLEGAGVTVPVRQVPQMTEAKLSDLIEELRAWKHRVEPAPGRLPGTADPKLPVH